jgi:hypothetical protein
MIIYEFESLPVLSFTVLVLLALFSFVLPISSQLYVLTPRNIHRTKELISVLTLY